MIPVSHQREGSGNENKERFYELKDLKDLNLQLNRVEATKIFVCNQCGHWNTVPEKDLIAPDDLKEKKRNEKVDLHIRVTPEFHIVWNKFKSNFGSSERAMIATLNEFYRNHQ